MPKLKEFVDNKSETFGIASHFRTNIECSHRVRTSILKKFSELIPESEYEFFSKG